jgi:RNA recognition motif-containing protein
MFQEATMKSIYVGNLPFRATEDEVREMFAAYGEVHEVKFVMDRETGRFRGFGFVRMDDAAALEAVEALDGKELGGRALRINEARERAPRPPRSGGY